MTLATTSWTSGRFRGGAPLALAALFGACAADPGAWREAADGRDESFLAAADETSHPDAVLELANTASFETLDLSASEGGVGLDVRAAEGILDYREGPDGEPDSSDDRRFETLEELDAIPYMGPVAFDRMVAFVDAGDGGDGEPGEELVHGVAEGSPEAEAILAVVNELDLATLDAADSEGGVGLDVRAAEGILDYREGPDGESGTSDDRRFETLAALDDVSYVAARAFAKLEAYAEQASPCRPAQEFELLLSNYDIDLTLGNGEHQGLALRYRRTFADCRVDESISYIFNHGRTISTAEPEHTAVVASKKRELSAEDLDAGADAYMEQCMVAGAGRDGFCDSMCGNDGYTLPPVLLTDDPGDGGSWNDEFTAKSAFEGDQHRRKAIWFLSDDYPAYGHNSNNDAEAQYDMFHRCGWDEAGDPEAFERNVSRTCEFYCDGDYGAPGSDSPRNIAKSKVTFCDGCMNLSSDLEGDLEPRSPLAGSRGIPFDPPKRVHGLRP